MPDADYSYLSTLGFAHLGDAVFELLVRTHLVNEGTGDVFELHKKTVSFVNSKSQAKMAKIIVPGLTEEEFAVFKRGRNAKLNSLPKNTSPTDYHLATALEALFGYLWLNKREDRIKELFSFILEKMNVA